MSMASNDDHFKLQKFLTQCRPEPCLKAGKGIRATLKDRMTEWWNGGVTTEQQKIT